MSSDQSFPRELLKQPPGARLAYFRALTIAHPLLLQAYDELRSAIRDSEPGAIILVHGPAGVGKTTLMQRVEKDFREQLMPELIKDVGRLPVVRIEAIAPDSIKFDWKDYFWRLLAALGEPESLINRKFIPTQPDIMVKSGMSPANCLKIITSKLRYAIEQTIRQRGPLMVLIDDAQHLAIGNSARKFLDHIKIIKSIADQTQTTYILTGTYEPVVLRNLMNGQISYRIEAMEFKRYSVENRDHQEAFISCLQTFQQHLPLTRLPELVKNWDYFYERCVGCIGVLKDWLTRTLALALENSGETFTRHYLQSQAISATRCAKMLSEAVACERKFTKSSEMQEDLLTPLRTAIRRRCRQHHPEYDTDQNGSKSQNHAFYQSWEISLPEMPPRSRLYHLAPIRVSTPDVESLTSFIMRLATAHCVSTGVLFRQEMSQLIKTRTKSMSIAYAYLDGPNCIEGLNGSGSGSPQCVSALESLTHQEGLRLLTMLPWMNILAPGSVMRKMHAWCPDCLADSKDSREPIYEKLAWTLIPVSVCSLHQRPLEESCPSCGRSSRVLESQSRAGHCFRCNRWLGSNGQARKSWMDRSEEELTEQIMKAKIVGEMLAISADLPSPFSMRDFVDVLNHYAHQVTAGNWEAFTRFLGCRPGTLSQLRSRLYRPTLNLFVTSILRLGLSVKEFLGCKEANIKSPKLDVIKILQAALTDPTCPSMGDLSRKISSAHMGDPYGLAPELCKQITVRHQQMREALSINLAQHIKRKREQERLSIKAIAEQSQVDYSSIADMEHRKVLRMSTIARLAKWLNIPFEQMVMAGNSNESPIGCHPQESVPECEMQAKNRFHDIQILREKLSAAMLASPPPTLRQIAEDLGYKGLSSLKGRCPDLYYALKERRKKYLKETLRSLEEKLKAVLTEEPPPSLNSIYLRFRMNKNGDLIRRHFPNLAEAIIQRHREHWVKRREEAKLEMEAALTEIPPPSIIEIARRMKCAYKWLGRNFPDLFHQVKAIHSEYMLQRRLAPKEMRNRSRQL